MLKIRHAFVELAGGFVEELSQIRHVVSNVAGSDQVAARQSIVNQMLQTGYQFLHTNEVC